MVDEAYFEQTKNARFKFSEKHVSALKVGTRKTVQLCNNLVDQW